MKPLNLTSRAISLAFLFSTVLALVSRAYGDSPKIVDLGYARYQGTTVSGVHQFLGMRYAEPPIGDLRWRAPRDPSPIPGTQRADTVSNEHRTPSTRGEVRKN